MGSHLQEFNYSDTYPTITSYIETFSNNWVSEIDNLKKISDEANSFTKKIDYTPWAVKEMIKLFDKQIKLLEVINQTVYQ